MSQTTCDKRTVIAACWLALALGVTDYWQREQAWTLEQQRLERLVSDEESMQQEQERLLARNEAAEKDRAWLRDVVDDRLPPVPAKLLGYVATLLPREARLSEFAVKWDAEARQWSFRIDGSVEADEETAQTAVSNLRRQLTAGPLPMTLVKNARNPGIVTLGAGSVVYPFSIEGGLHED